VKGTHDRDTVDTASIWQFKDVPGSSFSASKHARIRLGAVKFREKTLYCYKQPDHLVGKC
jgi:hypothetical protein